MPRRKKTDRFAKAAGRGERMESIKEMLAIGKENFEHKRYDDAEHYLRRVIEENPYYADVFNMLGVISHAQGKFASAIEHFENALKRNPRYTEAILNLAVLYNDLGKYEKAKALYAQLKGSKGEKAAKIEPVLRGKLSNLHADIGDIYRSIGLFDLAVDEYKKALSLNPAYMDIRTKLGQALRENGRPNDSLVQLREVLKKKSSFHPALIQLGITFYTLGKVKEARQAWKKVLEKEPGNDCAKMYLRLCDATQAVSKAPRKRPLARKTKPLKKTVRQAKPSRPAKPRGLKKKSKKR
jgi:tetratricopeptide (TPR) repeat protein